MNQILELIDISLLNSAGSNVFDCLNFSLQTGETVLITGPTGTGKTSLIELLTGIQKPVSGSIFVFGKELNIKKERVLAEVRKNIGGIGGIFSLISYRTVFDNLTYPLILKGYGASYRKRRIPLHSLTC